ncbi:Glucan 1,3-alpha-glucosidase [Balamuthia mandrillaris]
MRESKQRRRTATTAPRLHLLVALGAFALLLLGELHLASAVKKEDFRQCNQASFCRRNRNLAPWGSYRLDLEDVANGAPAHGHKADVLRFPVLKTEPDGTTAALSLELSAYDDGRIARLRLNEREGAIPDGRKGRYEVQDVLLEEGLLRQAPLVWHADTRTVELARTGAKVVLTSEPALRVEFYDPTGALVLSANEQQLLNFEQRRERRQLPPAEEAAVAAEEQGEHLLHELEEELEREGELPLDPPLKEADYYDAEEEGREKEEEKEKEKEEQVTLADPHGDGAWEEPFRSHHDSKPYGPESVGMDFSFVGAQHLYGLPEHASKMALKNTKDANGNVISEPYRLFNLDVFEYELDLPMALYGAVPLVIAHSASRTTGLFWLNAAETFVDVSDRSNGKWTHWFSESGIIDTFVLFGPKPKDVLRQYAYLTGTTPLPQLFSIAYHQCRWNYKDEADVAAVDGGFDEHDIPYDVIWLDIEHTNGKRYFTWDPTNFPTPEKMQKQIADKGRKMVTIIDPHIKSDNGYHVFSEAKFQNFFVKDRTGEHDFEGWCWPGSSQYLDFLNKEVRDWWSSLFSYDKYVGSTPILYTWNDMNEPSVFNGPEVSMHRDALHHGGWEHRDVHNLYGMYFHMATFNGLLRRNQDQNDRPFVLSRSFFAGSQRYGAIWTGDNAAKWDHLEYANPMLISLGLGGITFCGADVGGFFGNVDAELLTRWYQAGVFYPFFRAHGHLDTKRREPWLFGEPYTSIIRNTIRMRYALLPYFYTLFYETTQNGTPVLRPLWLEYPTDTNTFEMDDQFLVGKDLLVKPVVKPGQTVTTVYLPQSDVWYDYYTHEQHRSAHQSVDTPIDKIAVFQRGGSILVRKDRPRRSSAQMKDDPYTIVVALDDQNKASGELYVDDGSSYDYLRGEFHRRKFTFDQTTLRSEAITDNNLPEKELTNRIERIVVMGLRKTPESVKIRCQGGEERDVEFEYDGAKGVLTVRRPDCLMRNDWTMSMQLGWF